MGERVQREAVDILVYDSKHKIHGRNQIKSIPLVKESKNYTKETFLKNLEKS